MTVIRDPKTFCFNFDWLQNVDENLIHEIELIIKRNQSFAENKIKIETEQLLLKYKHENDIHEHGKQQSKWITKICSWLFIKIGLKKFQWTCCSSKFNYLLHAEKYKKTV